MPKIILGTSSPSRRTLFKKFNLPHQCISPDIDESPLANETGEHLTQRLSKAKSEKLVENHRDDYIITGDQLIEMNGVILGKPNDRKHAIEQLLACSNQTGSFHTSMTFYDPQTQHSHEHTINGHVQYQKLDQTIIERYLDKDQPWHAAGSICLEAHGFTLLKTLQSDDPYAILGMNMLWLSHMLRLAEFEFY